MCYRRVQNKILMLAFASFWFLKKMLVSVTERLPREFFFTIFIANFISDKKEKIKKHSSYTFRTRMEIQTIVFLKG